MTTNQDANSAHPAEVCAPDRTRYVATLTVAIEFDAISQAEAGYVRKALEQSLAFAAPRGRDAFLRTIESRLDRA